MKRPQLKRIKRRADGYYYPQGRWFFFWFDYDESSVFSTCTSVRFSTEDRAREFLDEQHVQELKAIELAKHAKTIKWEEAQ